MRPFFNRAWKMGTSTNKSGSGTPIPFSGGSMGRSRTGHQRVGSKTDVALDDMDGHDDAASHESQQGIVRTVEVSLDWKKHSQSEEGNANAKHHSFHAA
jgi:hypothetical protein